MKCIRNAFKSNARLKLAKNKANAKHYPEVEFLLFENYSHSSSTLSTKTVEHILKNKPKKKSTNGHKFSKYKKCLSMTMLTCIKQHLLNIPGSIHEKVKQH